MLRFRVRLRATVRLLSRVEFPEAHESTDAVAQSTRWSYDGLSETASLAAVVVELSFSRSSSEILFSAVMRSAP
jgi:hypothetical protein